MEWMRELGRRSAMLLNRRQFREDLEEEMRLHIDLRRQQQTERGLGGDEAGLAAHRRFGNADQLKERSHAAWGWSWLESFVQDVVYGIRGLLRSPGVTIVALLSLALGIGANTAIFSLIDAVMLRSLPVKDPGRLVILGKDLDNGISDSFARTDLYAYPVYRRIQKENQVFSDTAAICSLPNDVHGYVAGRSEQEPIHVQLVSGTYFDTLGVEPLLGRVLSDRDDDTEGDHPVAVVSYNWWKRDLGGNPDVLDQTIRIDMKVYSIVGVAPPEFFGSKVGAAPDVWIPLSMEAIVPPHYGGYRDNTSESLYIIGRLKPGVTNEQATANINIVYQQIFHQLLSAFAEGPHMGDNAAALAHARVPLTSLATGISDIRRQGSSALRILMAVVALVLLIACANIANLLLARSTARARELAVRQALGAGRWRIVRQLLTESLTLAVAGGALGIAFASFGSRLLVRMMSDGPEIVPLDVSINTTLLLFTLGVTLLTAILFGTVPAIRATRLELTAALKSGRGASSASAAKNPLAKVLVVTQLVFSLVLLVGAGLFLRSLVNLNRVDSGFNGSEKVLLFKMDESSAGYKSDDARLPLLHHELEERVSALPGIAAVSSSSFTFGEGSWNNSVFVQGFDNDKTIDVKHDLVGKGYFATMGIPIIAGRDFEPQDMVAMPKVAIISQQMAKTLFPSGSPIGRHYGLSQKNDGMIEVIGVAADVKFYAFDEPADQHTIDYYPASGVPQYLGDFEVRYSGDRGAIAAEVRNAIHTLDPHIPITRIETLDERLASSMSGQRALAQLCSFFGLLAVFLASIGIYGLMSYLVARRTGEIGVRMALGANPANVRRLVMREILIMVAIGIAIGVPVTLTGGRLVQSMLFELKSADPLSVAGAVVLLIAVTAMAGYLPARRASRVDPAVALRCE